MKRAKWIVAVLLVLVMSVFGGCADRGELNDGTINNPGDGTMNDSARGSDYDSNFNDAGFIDDVTDDVKDSVRNGANSVKNGVNDVKNGMNTVENDTKTNLGLMAEEPQLNR